MTFNTLDHFISNNIHEDMVNEILLDEDIERQSGRCEEIRKKEE